MNTFPVAQQLSANLRAGKYGKDWIQLARPVIEERMHEYEGDQIQFNLLSLCKSPLLTIPTQLAMNVNSLITVEKYLSHLQPDWYYFTGEESSKTLRGPSAAFMLTHQLLDVTKASPTPFYKFETPGITTAELFEIRAQLLQTQTTLQTAIIDELAAVNEDNERAANRRHDYTPMIYTWIRFLAENGTLQGFIEEAERERERDRF
jgi:ubiquitin carboxyl-terminal hydrolase L5